MARSHSTESSTSPQTDKDAARGYDEGRLRLAAIVETAVDGIITIDERGIVESFNPSAARLFGYAPEEVIGNNIKILMPPQYREHHDEYLSSYVKTGVKKIIGIGREVTGRRKDGTIFPMHLSVSEVHLGHRRLFTGIVHDLTEQKTLEKQVLQAERLATIGKMAAKVAHEIRNPLSSISLNAELLQDELNAFTSADTAEAQALLQSMMAEIDRVTSLTEEYLQFSRLPEPQPVLVSLNQVLEDTLGFVSHELRQKRIEVEYFFKQPSLPVRCDAVQVRRVFLNIIRNAIEAMPKGGKLLLTAESAGNSAAVHIQDTGVGIPAQEIDKIFDPFFTTKEFGTGLGLAIVQQIVNEHGGRISCVSNEHAGTTFSIYLPLTENK